MRLATLAGPALLAVLVLSGSLSAPIPRDEVAFSAVKRAHFDALGVVHHDGDPTDAPLVVRVRLVGDAATSDVARATGWLREHAGVELVAGDRGAPLFLTHGDLSATSGRATLGATLRTGMAVEVGRPEVTSCVIAHEVLHFLGLKHVDDARNVMHPQCTHDRLDKAGLAPWQHEALARLQRVDATTPRGMEVWATRG